MHNQSFTKNGQGQQQQQNNGQANGAPAAPAVTQPPVIVQPQQPEPVQNGGPFSIDGNFMSGMSLEFADPNMNGDVLQDFDFDSFLHNDGDNADSFAFDTSAFLENEVIAE